MVSGLRGDPKVVVFFFFKDMPMFSGQKMSLLARHRVGLLSVDQLW